MNVSRLTAAPSLCTAAITIYVALASEFVARYLYNRPLRAHKAKAVGRQSLDQKTKLMLLSLSLSSLFIFIR